MRPWIVALVWLVAISLLAELTCAQESSQKSEEAAEVLSVSWYTRTLRTTDVGVLIASGPPPHVPQEILGALSTEEQAAIEQSRRNGSRLDGLVWYGFRNHFAAAYMDPSSGAVSEPWAGMPEQGLPRFPLGSAACGRTPAFSWDSSSGNLDILSASTELPGPVASRLRHIEFLIAVDESPERAFREWVSHLHDRG